MGITLLPMHGGMVVVVSYILTNEFIAPAASQQCWVHCNSECWIARREGLGNNALHFLCIRDLPLSSSTILPQPLLGDYLMVKVLAALVVLSVDWH